MVSSKGDVYTGDWEHDKQCGYGEMVLANGDRYCGQFNDGVMNGFGKHEWTKSGDVFEGNWENGEMHGNGVLTTNHGRYEGHWNRGIKSGKGRLDLPGKVTYVGTFKSGSISDTFGIIRSKDGSKFEVRPRTFHDPEMEQIF